MKYIAPEMEKKALEVEDILLTGEGTGSEDITTPDEEL